MTFYTVSKGLDGVNCDICDEMNFLMKKEFAVKLIFVQNLFLEIAKNVFLIMIYLRQINFAQLKKIVLMQIKSTAHVAASFRPMTGV